MPRSAEQLREDALAIWRAGLEAVRSERLIADNVRVEEGLLLLGDHTFDLAQIGRIVVVGAGKAGAGMAAGLEAALGPELLAEKQVGGLVNVPADCVRPLTRIKLHAARPAGVNEPTEQGAVGSREILRLVEALGSHDLCICLLSGGASALLPAPVDGISLADKLQVTRFLSGAGANIQQLNTVRKQLSRLKGGGIARACRAGRLVTLIISDVPGDPLDIIGSGPTVPDTSTPAEALAVLQQFAKQPSDIPAIVWQALREKTTSQEEPSAISHQPTAIPTHTSYLIPHTSALSLPIVIGNNAVAVDAAGLEAERRGYSAAMNSATRLEGQAEEVGRHLAGMALEMRGQRGPDCLISGGEPVVQLAPAAKRGRGGRNQQLVLAALDEIGSRSADHLGGIVILSGGTDGEDGPTDAAGAWFDAEILGQAAAQGLDPADFLARNDAYHFFEPLTALIKTGPTHTNVCDLRVVVVDRVETEGRN
ncbi:MAG: glycerate kinase [Pirellulales bacterium]